MDTIGNFGIAQVEDDMNTFEHHPQDSRVKPTEVAPTCGVFGNSIEGKDCLVKQGGGEDAPRAREETPDVPHLSVRRLMPIETERLMGFPDNWTRIPWRGKPADECPDAPRYKACGNSMGVNCMRWIGLGIEAVEAKHK